MDEKITMEQNLTTKNTEKKRTYQNGQISFNSEEFEALVDVFRTLLEWSKDLEAAKS